MTLGRSRGRHVETFQHWRSFYSHGSSNYVKHEELLLSCLMEVLEDKSQGSSSVDYERLYRK